MTEIIGPHGRYFEEFKLGDWAISAGRTVSEADIVNFAGVSGDFSQIHTDAEYGRQSGFGQRVAHGLLEVAMASGLLTQLGFLAGTSLALRELTWKFSLPVFIGDTITAKATVGELKAAPRLKGGLVTFQIEVTNQEGRVVGTGAWVMLVASR